MKRDLILNQISGHLLDLDFKPFALTYNSMLLKDQ